MKRNINYFMFILLLLLAFQAGKAQESKSAAHSEWDNGLLKFRSADGNFRMRFDVRLFLDGAAYFENKNKGKLSDGTDLRRGRFAMKVKLWKNWRAEWDIDAANYVKKDGKKDNELEVKDMWFGYKGLRNTFIQIGQFKPQFSLNELTSSLNITFLERAYPNVFASDRRMGLGFNHWDSFTGAGVINNWYIAGGVFGENFEGIDKKAGDEGYAFAGRFVYTPMLRHDRLLHLGASVLRMTPDVTEDGVARSINIDARPETKVSRIEFMDTGDIFDVRFQDAYSLEGAAQFGALSFQSEYIKTYIKRRSAVPDMEFDGGYAFVSWLLTGENRPYSADEAEFSRPVPQSEKGALELAFRYSHLNLTDMKARVYGGKANNYTIAFNWYVNPNVRFMLNYIMVDNSIYANGGADAKGGKYTGDDDFSLITLRALVNF